MELVKDKDKINKFKKRAEELVAQMTLEEKVSQTLFTAPAIERLNIPAYNWWNEALHGVARAGTATVFPQAIALAAAFDEDFAEKIADAISTEGRAKFNLQQQYLDTDIYKGLTFWSPNVNIFRDPRWGRGHETFGEDPYLTSRLGVRFVKGIQGHDESYLKAAACAKHFAVHSGPEDIRHSFNAVVTKKDLYETYLPAFKACVEEGQVEAVMGAYNRTNGAPCCGNKVLLKDILREEWGFSGHVVSDCWAIKDFHEGHGVTSGPIDSVSMAMNNGCDLNCGNLFAYLTEAVKQGKVPEERLDEAVVHLFTTRMKLGVFDEKGCNPYDAISYLTVDSEEMKELNLEAAGKCAVLLKNQDNLLPLNLNNIKTLGVIGPNANSRKALIGNYEGISSRYITVLEGLQDYVGSRARILYSEGCHLYRDRIEEHGVMNDRLSEVKGICEASDAVILCMGLDAGLEGEEGDAGNQYASGDKPNLNLPGIQKEVLKAACESGRPVVLVLMSGSALSINYAQEHVPAILQGWYPGAQGGKAIAQILFGEKNPEGKLPVTFYRTTEELPEFTDYSMKGRTYRYMEKEALYPFGYGLSYTEIVCENAAVSSDLLLEDGLDVHAVFENKGSRQGTETLQIYVKAERENTPNAQLKGLLKVSLLPGEKKSVSVHLEPSAFALYDEEGSNKVLAGSYQVFAGTAQPDSRSTYLTGRKPASFTVKVMEERIV